MVGTVVPSALTYCAYGWAPLLFANWFGHGWKDKGEGVLGLMETVGRSGRTSSPSTWPLQVPHLLQASLAKEIFPFHWLWMKRERERVNMKITSRHMQLQDVIKSHPMSFMWSYVLALKRSIISMCPWKIWRVVGINWMHLKVEFAMVHNLHYEERAKSHNVTSHFSVDVWLIWYEVNWDLCMNLTIMKSHMYVHMLLSTGLPIKMACT